MPRGKAQDSPKDPKVKWVIMLYIAADSTIANFAVESLKQINNSVGKCVCACLGTPPVTDTATVVVAAQFALDAPAGQIIPRYIFDDKSNGSIRNSLRRPLVAPSDMTEEEALISFLRWVYKNKKCKDADKYALILWGHGPQLMLQPPPAQNPDNPNAPPHASASLYLTPEELRVALNQGIPPEKGPLDIIAFDACSMSNFETACEIREYAKYMVASQEEIPDPSFPYDTLVGLFRRLGNNTEKLLEEGVAAYVNAYEDYIIGAATGMPPVTLAALRLEQCEPLQIALCLLACALLNARSQPGLPSVLLEARQDSRSFVAGLYVDLYDFCSNLKTLLRVTQVPDGPAIGRAIGRKNAKGASWMSSISEACQAVMDALPISDSGLILQNSSADTSCNGVSIYFPYRSDEENSSINAPLVKGGPLTGGGKGLNDALNSTAFNLLLCARRDLICETEGYYSDLQLAQDTDWYRFIAEVWTKIVIDSAPHDLDVVYSAQQGAINLASLLEDLTEGDQQPGCSCKEKTRPGKPKR
jgi:hypothetical protein